MGVSIRCLNCGQREDASCSKCASRSIRSIRIENLEEENKRLKDGLLTSGNAILEKENRELVQEIRILQSSLGLKEIEKSDLAAEIRALHTQLNEQESTQSTQSSQLKINRLESKLEAVKRKLGEWMKLMSKK